MSERQTALVTGASNGIGKEIAKILVEQGYHVVVTGRNAQALSTLQKEATFENNPEMTVLPMDLSLAGSAESLVKDLDKQNLHIDLLINNAGFGDYGFFHLADRKKINDMLQVNIVALTQLTHHLLSPMIERGHGRIMNVASTAAFQPGPLMAVYYATKAFVLSFSEAIADEVKDTGVTVTAFCPGPTASGFQQAANLHNSRLLHHFKMPDARTVAGFGFPPCCPANAWRSMASGIAFLFLQNAFYPELRYFAPFAWCKNTVSNKYPFGHSNRTKARIYRHIPIPAGRMRF